MFRGMRTASGCGDEIFSLVSVDVDDNEAARNGRNGTYLYFKKFGFFMICDNKYKCLVHLILLNINFIFMYNESNIISHVSFIKFIKCYG